MTYHRVCYKINTTCSRSEAGTAYPSYSLVGFVLLNLNICLCSCYVDHWLSFCPYWSWSWSWLHYLGNVKFNNRYILSTISMLIICILGECKNLIFYKSDMLKIHIFRSFLFFVSISYLARLYIVFLCSCAFGNSVYPSS